MNAAIPYGRGKQILRVLAEHGPMTMRGLQSVVRPKIQTRKLREVLQRLRGRGLVEAMNRKSFGGKLMYHQLPQDDTSLKEIAILLGTDPKNSVRQPSLKYGEYIHSQSCAIWCEYIRRLYPNALVLRDIHFEANPIVAKILQGENNDWELRPDILLVLKDAKTGRMTSIGVEIERSKKTDERILRKLRWYADLTLVDGIFYICESPSLNKRICDLYRGKVVPRASRTKHYGEHFLVFSSNEEPPTESSLLVGNATAQSIQFEDWVRALLAHDADSRRSQRFEHPAPMRPEVGAA